MKMSTMATNPWTITSVMKAFISKNKKWFRTYVTADFGDVNDNYAGLILDDPHIEQVGVPKKKYEVCKKVE